MNCELCESRQVYHVIQHQPIVLNVCRECHVTLSTPMRLEGCVAGPAWIEIVERTQTEFARRCERLRVLASELCSTRRNGQAVTNEEATYRHGRADQLAPTPEGLNGVPYRKPVSSGVECEPSGDSR